MTYPPAGNRVPGKPREPRAQKPRTTEYLYKMGPATQANPALLNTGPATSTQLAALQSLMLTSDAESASKTASGPRKPWDYLKPGIRPLLLILALQAALSMRLVWANTAFQDEALYLWTGHLELNDWLHHAQVSGYFASHLSGAPVVYPPIAALADSLGGLAAARMLSLIFMLGSTILLYFTAQRLFDRRVAIMAAAFFGTLGWADQLGAFATYDAFAIFLTALAAWLVVRAQGWASEPVLIIAACVLTLADAAKYATALWNPIVAGLVVLTAANGGWPRKIVRGIRFTIYVCAIILAGLRLGGKSYIQGIDFTTLHRQIDTGSTAAIKVVDVAWGWLGLLILLAFLGIFLSWYDRGQPNALPVLLFIAGILAPAAQAHNEDIISLHKHIVFGAWFTCMMAGYAASKLTHLDNKLSHGALISAVVVLAGAISGYFEVSAYSTTWPDVSTTMPALETAIVKAHCPCLIFQNDAAHYYLPASSVSNGVIGPYAFSFHDSHTWKTIQGDQAMAAAIADGYFGAVEVDASHGDAEYRVVTNALRASKQYTLVSSVPWSQSPGEPTQVWRLSIGSGQS